MNSKTRQSLKREAQSLKPLAYIGNEGISKNFVNNVKELFNTNEIIKIKNNRDDNEKKLLRLMAEEIAQKTNSEIVYIIGKTIILYKKNDKKHN